jgi:hypothetical protein
MFVISPVPFRRLVGHGHYSPLAYLFRLAAISFVAAVIVGALP